MFLVHTLPVFLSNNCDYIKSSFKGCTGTGTQARRHACVCESVLSLACGTVFLFAWKTCIFFEHVYFVFRGHQSRSAGFRFLPGEMCRRGPCLWSNTTLTQWSNLSLWRRDRIEELGDKTELFIDPEGRGSHVSNRSHHFEDWGGRKAKKTNPTKTHCLEWFTVMPTHCATSVTKVLAEMCCSTAQIYQDGWRETGRKTNGELKTLSSIVFEILFKKNHYIYQ